MINVYGIKQCDTCRKALNWLAENNITHQFHDLRVQGLDESMLQHWLASEFEDILVNKRSTTWRKLGDAEKESEAAALMGVLLKYPTLVKRPVFVDGKVLAVGFTPAVQQRLLAKAKQ